MHAKTFSATTVGVHAHPVQVEVDVTPGIPAFYIVGLPDTALKESSKRILTSLRNSGFSMPAKKITVNLAPADLKKEGTILDLPIALGILIASNHLHPSLDFLHETLFLGELSLDGSIGFIKGALAIAYDAKNRLHKKRIILPKANAHEAALIDGITVIGVTHITEVIAYIRNEKPLQPAVSTRASYKKTNKTILDFGQVKGQQQAKRALQIAAAGHHNVLFIGPPGSGKTMLAKRLPSIMPDMSFDEAIQTSKIYSICGKLGNKPLVLERPFRAPHHTISQAGLVGGGSYPQPGEISLAHNGILFLDELTEFKRDTLEVLRQPLESKSVCISRVNQTLHFPASFLLVAALNPCPCGFLGDKKRPCTCTPQQINRYLSKLSGPLLDRIDLQIYVQSVDYETIHAPESHITSSQELNTQITAARNLQELRLKNNTTSEKNVAYNSFMSPGQIEKQCLLTPQAEHLIKKVFDRLSLSMRGYHKVLKVSRTIADLENSERIDVSHLQEALMYRSLDKHLESSQIG